MQINTNILDELYREAGEEKVRKAKNYVQTRKVNLIREEYENKDNFEISAQVRGTEIYNTTIRVKNGEIDDVTCECEDYYQRFGTCKHIVATIIEYNEKNNKRQDIKGTRGVSQKINSSKYRSFHQIVNTLYNEEIEKLSEEEQKENIKDISLEPKLIYDRYNKSLRLEIKIGNKRLYKIRNLSEFYDNMLYKKKYRYGAQLEFIHTKDVFIEESKPLLEFVLKQAENIKNVNSEANISYRYYGKALSESEILLNNTSLDELFDILKGQKILVQKEYTEDNIEFMYRNPSLEFKLEKDKEEDYRLYINIEEKIGQIAILQGKQYTYVLKDDGLYRCTKEFEETTLKLFKIFKENFVEEVYIHKEQLPELFSVVIPNVKNQIKITEEAKQEIEEYRPEKLEVKAYLDVDQHGYITADIKFCYGEEEVKALDEKTKINAKRDIIAETKAINMLGKTGFMLYEEKQLFILPQEEKIYEFLTTEIDEYMQKFEVLVTDNFKSKQVRQPKIGTIGVKVENNLLSVDLSNLNIEPLELEEIMKKYALKKKYHKLKDGSYLSLEDSQDLEFLDKAVKGMDISYKDLESGKLKLPVHRTLYLNSLLKNIENTEITKNNEYKEIVKGLDKENIEEEIQVPKSLDNVLRYYQKTGYKWLKVLDNYKFGGILADDMGLGKTIQMLAVIISYIQETKEEERKSTIVVCPSSLSLNWQNEANKFTNELRTMVIRGNAKEREEQIKQIEKYDLVITSYDLLKRDIEVYREKNYTFKYIIADEAQYLKNSNTQNARAIKEINAETRYALTGTPIENSLAELWSIFDYIMPGYLFTYKKFKNTYELPIVRDNDQKAMQKLKMLIEPFVLRRTKKQVLTELPDKSIAVLRNVMKEEQEKLYLSYLTQTKMDVEQIINKNGFEKSKIQILAALTRLRQICCHPSLFIEGYTDGSSKLEQCIEIVQEATQSNHKILLFSGYTSMFDIIEEELKQKGIKYFKLTGSTKVDERLQLVDEFNANEDIKVFLISLKAGGTGLNLTGADVVIHYDPWWNASAEGQATDRAYRIGQRRNVQVYKLITKNSIEEKIYELQQKKSELIDNVLDTQTTFINKISKEDIMNLFSL
ncbi:MAG: DEAD/DEAH box helicase family protein [Clostridia bacterium]|nr:DEAD/DEAH box helicase family protein [Clostridia bacterium]